MRGFAAPIYSAIMVTNGWILVLEVSIEPYWGLLFDASILNDNTNPVFLLGTEIYILP